MTRPKILIDCDPGHDDAVAILFAARQLELVGLTTVHGNSSIDNTTRNALAVLELAGIEVPLAKGTAGPLAQARRADAAVHGQGGLDGAELPPPRRKPLDVHAVDFIIEMASRHRGALVLAAIGPETNVALALRREPRLKHWLREIAVMGGSTDRGNITPAAEFNIYCDPEAAAIVFNSGIPLRMVGLNVTRRTGLDDADIARLRASRRNVARVAADLMDYYLARQRQLHRATAAIMHDACAISPYVNANLITFTRARVDIELAGMHTRGMTVCDLDRPEGTAGSGDPYSPNANVAVDIDSRRVIELVLEALMTYP